jgi:hypothetical protein
MSTPIPYNFYNKNDSNYYYEPYTFCMEVLEDKTKILRTFWASTTEGPLEWVSTYDATVIQPPRVWGNWKRVHNDATFCTWYDDFKYVDDPYLHPSPNILSGIIEIRGSFYSHDGFVHSHFDTTGLSNGKAFLYADVTNQTVSMSWSNDVPSYNNTFGGWYNGDKKAIMVCVYVGGKYYGKKKINKNNNDASALSLDGIIVFPGNIRLAGTPVAGPTTPDTDIVGEPALPATYYMSLGQGFHSFVVQGAGGGGGGGRPVLGADNCVIGGAGGAGGYVEESVYVDKTTKAYAFVGLSTTYTVSGDGNMGTGGGAEDPRVWS